MESSLPTSNNSERLRHCDPPEVELVLSRPAYQIGGTVVGTVRLISSYNVGHFGDGVQINTATGGNSNNSVMQPLHDGDSQHTDGEDSASLKNGRRHRKSSTNYNLEIDSASFSSPRKVGDHSTEPPPASHPRSVFKSAQLYIAGRCRIDPRWHNSQSLAQLYGTHPHLSVLDPYVESTAVDSYFGERNDGVHIEGGTTVCFWATNVVDLLELKERGESGSWENLRPRPLKLSGDDQRKPQAPSGVRDDSDEHTESEVDIHGYRDENSAADTKAAISLNWPKESLSKLEEKQMTFSFRAELPVDIPPSAKTACARYFYSAVVCVVTNSGETMIAQTPFAVNSRPFGSRLHVPQPEVIQSSGRVKIGSCTAVAHANGFPCYISATSMMNMVRYSSAEFFFALLHTAISISDPQYLWHRTPPLPPFLLCRTRAQSKISVNRNASLCSHATSSDVRTLRVTDQTGSPCCILTLVGTSIMCPGGRALIEFEFNEDLLLMSRKCAAVDGSAGLLGSLLPCHRVNVSLQGEEVACHDDGSRRRTRAYIFDSANSAVETGYTDSVSLSLALPLDCPCSLRTDLVEIKIMCKVEITISRQNGEGYDVLRLELPCEVAQDVADDNGAYGDEDENVSLNAVGRMTGGEQDSDFDNPHGGFLAVDIMHDLRMLSLRMHNSIKEKCLLSNCN